MVETRESPAAASSLRVRVARKAVEAQDICSFEFVDAAGAPLPPFAAGAHVDVHLPGGIVRQYSLCNPPTERERYVIAVLRESGGRGGSRLLHDAVHEGDVLTIGAPRNHFPLAAGARRSLLLAGGIGVTPILCMAQSLLQDGADFEMHYCTRSRQRTAFRDRIQSSALAPRVHLHHDDGPSAQKLDLSALLAAPPPGVHLYVCGPRGFIDAVLGAAKDRGWPDAQVHHEFFSGGIAARDADTDFTVSLARSGLAVQVHKDQTILQALAQVGVEVPSSCEQGVCGSCLTRVLEGEPDHRDVYLSSDERTRNDQILVCCSRSKSPLLVLDL